MTLNDGTRPLSARLDDLRRLRTARGATLHELNLLTELGDHLDSLTATVTRRVGLRRELEVELFGEVQPLMEDGGEDVTARALDVWLLGRMQRDLRAAHAARREEL